MNKNEARSTVCTCWATPSTGDWTDQLQYVLTVKHYLAKGMDDSDI